MRVLAATAAPALVAGGGALVLRLAHVGPLDVLDAATVDEALLCLAGSLGWAVVVWSSALATLAVFAAASGLPGRCARRLLHVLAPRCLRGAFEVALGVSLLAGPMAYTASAASATTVSVEAVALDRPALDRPTLGTTSDAWQKLSLDRPDDSQAPTAQRLQADRNDVPRESQAAGARTQVRRGDSLWLIAERGLGAGATDAAIAREWPRWFDANRDVIGADPSLIRPGQRLLAPADLSSQPP